MISHCKFPDCISSSIIKHFLDNPLEWFAETTKGIEFNSLYTYAGNLLHDAIAIALGATVPENAPPANLTAEEIAEAHLRADAAYFTWRMDFALRKVKVGLLHNKPMVEQPFSLTIPGIEFPLVGTVDFVSNKNVLLDWKMTTLSPDAWSKRNLHGYQHYIYAMWYLKQMDPGASRVQFYYVLIGQEKIHWLNYSVNVDEIVDWTENVLKPTIRMMKGALND